MNEIKLKEYARGSGCGCKIDANKLREILINCKSNTTDSLLLGFETSDDAAVFKLNNDLLLITTTDFFSPIVDDAFTFGKIAAINALSDIYAMGATPIFALAILGFPVDKLPLSVANSIMLGAKNSCDSVHIQIAGGHTIDSAEPFFGLVVNGTCLNENLKRNNTATPGDILYLTKKIGTGIINAAHNAKQCAENDYQQAVESMLRINTLGQLLSKHKEVTAMTDVTGFGVLGHVLEMANQSSIELYYDKIKWLPNAKEYAAKMFVPSATYRNWNSVSEYVNNLNAEQLLMLCDPQTSGGLLIAVAPSYKNTFEQLLIDNNLAEHTTPIGKIIPEVEKKIIVL